MRKNLIIVLIVLLSAAYNCKKAPDAEKAEISPEKNTTEMEQPAGESFKLDTEGSVIKWIGTKVTGRHNGVVKIKSGEIFVENDKITGGNFIIDMTTIEDQSLEGELKQKLETHLKDTDFFEVQKYPEAKFVVTSVEPLEEADQYKVTGNLTMKGITKGVTFTSTIKKNEANKPTSATANFNIDRQLWGIIYKGKADDLIANEINLDLDLKTKL